MNQDQGLLAEEPGLFAFIIVLALWSTIWKGFALYRAGANRSTPWFITLFILNTAGILEILYLFVFSKRTK
jgi:methionyl-tRNA synthetase